MVEQGSCDVYITTVRPRSRDHTEWRAKANVFCIAAKWPLRALAFAREPPQAEDKVVSTIGAGGSFGELALLYNDGRAATIKCSDQARLWRVNGSTFKSVVVESTYKKRKYFEQLLDRVPLLSALPRPCHCVLAAGHSSRRDPPSLDPRPSCAAPVL